MDHWEFIALERRLWKAQLLVSLNYVMSQTQSDDSRKKDGQRLQPSHTDVASTAVSGPPVAPSQDRHTRFPVTADDFVSFCHTSVA